MRSPFVAICGSKNHLLCPAEQRVRHDMRIPVFLIIFFSFLFYEIYVYDNFIIKRAYKVKNKKTVRDTKSALIFRTSL